MFGYVKTDFPNLYVKDTVLYKAMYCGLCKSIGCVSGIRGRLALNYDLTYVELDMIASMMYEKYLFREFSKLKTQANRFTTKDLNVFSPANERNSFSAMFKEIQTVQPTILIVVPALAEIFLNLSKQFGLKMLGGKIK